MRAKPMIAALAMAGALSLAVATTAAAATMDLAAKTPAEAEAIVYLDARQFLDEPELAPIRDRIFNYRIDGVIDQVYSMTGIDLTTDIDEALYALRFAEMDNGVLFLRGRWDEGYLITLLQASGLYDSHGEGDYTLHGFWDDDRAEMRYILFDLDVMAIGSLEAMKTVATTMSGGHPALTENSSLHQAIEGAPAGAVALIAGRKPEALADDRTGRMALRRIKAFSLAAAVDESGGRMALRATAEDAASAELVKELAEGGLALLQLSDAPPGLRDLAAMAQTSVQENTVVADIRLPEGGLEELRVFGDPLGIGR